MRDIALAASGLLNPRSAVRASFRRRRISCSCRRRATGPRCGTRTGRGALSPGLYTFRFRSVPYPVLQTFDAPNGDSSCVRRARSNTPLQALTTLNEPLFVECAAGSGAEDARRRRQGRCRPR